MHAESSLDYEFTPTRTEHSGRRTLFTNKNNNKQKRRAMYRVALNFGGF